MKLYKNKYRTDSIRLKGWDYRTPAWYFVTVCTQNRKHFFGEICNGIMGLSQIGNIAYLNWVAIPDHFGHVKLGEWIVMPNHVHGLIGIMEWPVGRYQNLDSNPRPVETRNFASLQGTGNEFGPLKSGSLSAIIHAYKSSVTRWARKNDKTDFAWQSRFHDHIVRNRRSLDRIRTYIVNNPKKWEEDLFYGIS